MKELWVVVLVWLLVSPMAVADQDIGCVNAAAAIALAGTVAGVSGVIIFYKPTPLTAEDCAKKDAAISSAAKCVCPSNGKAADGWIKRKQCDSYEVQYEAIVKELQKKKGKAMADLEKEQKAKKPDPAKIAAATKRKSDLDKLENDLKVIPKHKSKTEDFNILYTFQIELQKT